ncbi:MAG: type II toxin-antitoxin system VapC family toxin [Rhodomicrobium sp.]
MAISPSRVCWDSCAWIALIQEEKIVEGGIDRVTRCKSVLNQAKKGKIEIAMSALCLAEVCRNRDIKDNDPQKIADFFEHDYLLLVNVDRNVGELARQLMMAGIPKLKPADACHIATAAITPDIIELHMFDEKLLDLNNKVTKADGGMLRICWPDTGGSTPPLLTN